MAITFFTTNMGLQIPYSWSALVEKSRKLPKIISSNLVFQAISSKFFSSRGEKLMIFFCRLDKFTWLYRLQENAEAHGVSGGGSHWHLETTAHAGIHGQKVTHFLSLDGLLGLRQPPTAPSAWARPPTAPSTLNWAIWSTMSSSSPSLLSSTSSGSANQRYVYCVVGMTQFFCKIIDPLGGRHHFLLILLDSVSDTWRVF